MDRLLLDDLEQVMFAMLTYSQQKKGTGSNLCRRAQVREASQICLKQPSPHQRTELDRNVSMYHLLAHQPANRKHS